MKFVASLVLPGGTEKGNWSNRYNASNQSNASNHMTFESDYDHNFP